MDLQEYVSLCDEAAQRWNVCPEVHPDDHIFRFIVENKLFKSKMKAVDYYFDDGARSAKKLKQILEELCGLDSTSVSLLEFVAGYGCVTRHIRSTIPFAMFTACDIHSQAVEFIRETLGFEAVLSASRPENLNLAQPFDAVFALSFFSHMPATTFGRWLRRLASFVKPGGFLIFTTHGLLSRRFIKDCQFNNNEGFFFSSRSEQQDLSTQDYGVMVTMPHYVFNKIFEIPGLMLTHFHEGYWWTHQDLYIAKVNEHVSPTTSQTKHLKSIHLADSKLLIQQVSHSKLIQRQIIDDLSSKDIAYYIRTQKIIKALGHKIAAKPGFGWLYRFRGLSRKLLGG